MQHLFTFSMSSIKCTPILPVWEHPQAGRGEERVCGSVGRSCLQSHRAPLCAEVKENDIIVRGTMVRSEICYWRIELLSELKNKGVKKQENNQKQLSGQSHWLIVRCAHCAYSLATYSCRPGSRSCAYSYSVYSYVLIPTLYILILLGRGVLRRKMGWLSLPALELTPWDH